jgi:hypothetical protein
MNLPTSMKSRQILHFRRKASSLGQPTPRPLEEVVEAELVEVAEAKELAPAGPDRGLPRGRPL